MMKCQLWVVMVVILSGAAMAQNLQWTDRADLPVPVAGYMAGVVDGKLLIAGGSYWENKQKHWSTLVQSFDPKKNEWSNLAPLPARRSDAASTTLGNGLYCFGGGSGKEVHDDALLFHDGQWSEVAEAKLPEPRLYAVAVTSGGYIYVLGGISRAGDYKTMSNALWRWRPGMKGWEVLDPLPGPGRISHAMVAANGDIYVLGGATTGPQDVKNLNDAYKYSTKAGKWTRLPDLSIANRAWWAVAAGNRVLVLAGYMNDFVKQTYWYDPVDGLTPAGELTHALADTKFFRIGDTVLGAGGESGHGIRGEWTIAARIRAQSR